MSQTLPVLSVPRKSLLHRVSDSHRGISIFECTTQLQQRETVDEELEVRVDATHYWNPQLLFIAIIGYSGECSGGVFVPLPFGFR